MLISLQAIMKRVHQLAARLCDPYQPERHYMRGPGPKWRARHLAAGATP